MEPRPFRHSLVPVILLVVFLGLPFARWWTWFLYRDHRSRYRLAFQPALPHARLLDRPVIASALGTDILRSYVVAIVRTPLELALIPALFIVAAPRFWLGPWFLIPVCLGWWLFMGMVVYHPALDGLLDFLRRLLAEGATLLVSVMVLVLAVCRIAEVDYVTTVLDSGAHGLIVQHLIALYALFWLYDYWAERAIGETFLGFLTTDDDAPSDVPYPHAGPAGPAVGRIRIHGGTRVAVVEEPLRGPGEGFNIFRPLDLMKEIAAAAGPESLARQRLPVLEAQTRFCRALPGLLLLFVVVRVGGHMLDLPREPFLMVPPATATATATASATLPRSVDRVPVDDAAPPHVFVVAASGGGSRAALYTLSVFKALSANNALHRVVCVSSVSGGSLTTACVARWWRDLTDAEKDPAQEPRRDAAWDAAERTVRESHIRYVLSSATEWRLARGVRLGRVLQESFQRSLAEHPGHDTLSAPDRPVLLFNTSLVGSGRSSMASAADATSGVAGGTLVITNLEDPRRLAEGRWWGPLPPDPGYTESLLLVALNDGAIPLSAAAAASANFPPVFSNLPIAVQHPEGTLHEWVTDGGAVENRGILGALYVLEDALAAWPPSTPLPVFHVLVVDASAVDPSFSSHWGLQAAIAAPRMLGNEILLRTLREVRERYTSVASKHPNAPPTGDAGVLLHDLTLPTVLRTKGSFGTHWMLPERVRLRQPDGDAEIWLDQDQLLEVFRELLSEDRPLSSLPSQDRSRVNAWLDEQDPRVGLDAALGR